MLFFFFFGEGSYLLESLELEFLQTEMSMGAIFEPMMREDIIDMNIYKRDTKDMV